MYSGRSKLKINQAPALRLNKAQGEENVYKQPSK